MTPFEFQSTRKSVPEAAEIHFAPIVASDAEHPRLMSVLLDGLWKRVAP
jgi:hypothetical protein